MYIEFWAFKVKCSQYGICGQVAFKNTRVIIIYFEIRQGGQQLSIKIQKKLKLKIGGAPALRPPSAHDGFMTRPVAALPKWHEI